jgi:hypothetical protein
MGHLTPSGKHPSDFRLKMPTEAGIYDYLIGGTHHTAADDEAARRILEIAPEAASVAAGNRRFLDRAVTYLARQGVAQYLDLGSGFPVAGQVHEIAGRIIPGPRVVYVDHDPKVIEKSRLLLRDHDNVIAINGDLRHPREIVNDPAVRRFIDWSRPVAVQLVAIMHFIPDRDDPKDIIAAFREHMSPGSHLVLSHATGGDKPDAAAEASKEWRNTRSPITLRSAGEIEEFFAGFEMIGRGLVTTTEWGTDAPPPTDKLDMLCAVGKLRERRPVRL